MKVIYLHGFASGPQSTKALSFKDRFDSLNLPIVIPDLENGDFENLTISKQLKVIFKTLDEFEDDDPIALVGSSMGGYLALLAAQLRPEVGFVYALCPGLNFVKRWKSVLTSSDSPPGTLPSFVSLFNHRHNKKMRISTKIFDDGEKWQKINLNREIPTRIVHGVHDETVRISESRHFAERNPWVQLVELNDDHTLLAHKDWIIDDCLVFLGHFNVVSP